ncbi:creatininase family protein [Jiangella asiatica]|uniref:Creatininase family protein n=1 Tax=Jiangella asiatica TaxID=2530372 RepID=A0A4R5DKX4_9ACTN|nr:creatininase family protein [Jiangella asiatica]TDE11495.1 creatininase family protein [Jiangella asiatica]
MGGLIDSTRVTGATWPDVVAGADLAVLPVGAFEWHGPHLPLGTDLLLAEGFARAWAEDTDAPSGVLYPSIAYTACPGQTRPWPGTVGVRPEVALPYLCDVLEGIVAAGFVRVLVVNGHDANMSIVRAAMEWVSGRGRCSLLLANWFQLITPEETTEIFGPLPARGHGGAYETSGVLGFAPDAVDLAATRDLPPRPKLSTPSPYVLVESRPTPWEGWSGHVSLVGDDAGRRVRELGALRLRELVEAWLAAPLPDPPGTAPSANGTPNTGEADA